MSFLPLFTTLLTTQTAPPDALPEPPPPDPAAVVGEMQDLESELQPAPVRAPIDAGIDERMRGRTHGVTQRPPAPTEPFWYGWQILLADGAAVTTLLISGNTGIESLATVAVVSLIFTGPIIHWAHGNVGRGFGSLGLRVGGPVVGMYTGVALASMAGAEGWDVLGYLVLGFLAGGAVSLGLDVGVLAWDNPPEAPPEEPYRRFSLAPAVFETGEGTTQYGLAGTF